MRVVPDGGIELLFSFEAKGGGRDAPLRRGGAARGDFFGARTRPLLVSGDGPVANVSARLRPGAARRFFDLAARELTDRSRDVATLWGDPGRRLTAEMARTTCWRERGRLLEGALLGRLDQAADREDEARVATAVAAIRRSGGRVPIAALCQRLGVGERRLERLFDAHVGLPPKTFARVVRFQRAHRRLLGGRAQGETAHVCGYADQAHMVRDFRRLAGETPGRLLPTRRR